MDTAYADAVIVAAGASRRMAGVDKMDASLGGRPLLQWSVAAMAAASSVDRIVVVARPDHVEPLRRSAWLADIAADRATIVAGGARRSDSVRAGVEATSASVVLVHDGARPLASAALVDAVAAAAARHGAAVPVVPVVDSLKRATGEVLAGSVEREGLVRTQTPQGARREILVESIEAAGSESFSDEAALLESRGVSVASVPGEAANLKVTDRDDLDLVRAIAAGREAGLDSGAVSFGFGQDSHGFGPYDGLRLGGIEIAEAPRLFGHSDGDVVLHALATAILSAAGLGDLGRRFPSDDPRTAGVDSSRLLGDVVERVAKAGWQVSRAQVALIGARPRLGGRLDDIRIRIGELLALGDDQVAVTASTGNLNGPEGAGRVITATALVSLVRR